MGTRQPGDQTDPLTRQVQLLVRQVGHWENPRWAAGGGRRASEFHQLVQYVADLGAAAEGRPVRPVPRLRLDTALPDQLRVVAADLVRASPEPATLEPAAAAVRRLRDQL
ncbi:hypothetical protein O7623_16190 [Solwaraspora sp. WMMD791]|uniref:hypothetical protein n=1 Tax=Solwaraspora sp. WMMD791 TaxID=3016086 RepID=UPI00249B7622|nr:hypothetical protein [Solwaraspora sp. WMMD791]WFE24969.1 hypothetical protein O7623_16190 [Solwaraspora sp. WMMD791]